MSTSPGIFFGSFWSDRSNRDLDDLIRAYGQLPANIARKHLRAAIRRSIKPFAPALRQATPRASGNLRRSVKTIVRFGSKVSRGSWGNFRGTAYGIVGFSKGGKDPKKRGDHSVIVESGTKPRVRKSGAATGRMPPRHMLRDTLAAKRSGILHNLEIEMGVSLERAARELANPRR